MIWDVLWSLQALRKNHHYTRHANKTSNTGMQTKLQTQLELEGTYMRKGLQNCVTAPLREVGGRAECMRFCGDAGDV
jgi:hypothetical protein